MIKLLMTMEERVSRSEERIARLNTLIFKRLEERRGLKNRIMNLEELNSTEFKMTMMKNKVIATEEDD